MIHREKKLIHFDIKSWVTCGFKIRPGKVDNWRIFESKWLNIKSQIESTLRVKLTQHWESNWLNIESQIYSTLRVKLTQHLKVKLTQLCESNWLNIESQIDSNIFQLATHFALSNYNSASDSTFKVIMTQFFLSVHWEKKLSHFDQKSWVKF